jgi:hypothetical protein
VASDFSSEESAEPPPWCRAAAETLYRRIEEIDDEAGQAAQVDQDSGAHVDTWTRRVAEVIAAHAPKAK